MKKTLTAFFAFAFLLTSGAPIAFSQELPEALKISFDKGMAAAGQNEWDLAIKYFSEVEKGQPFYFPVYFNLALAHSKAGHELAAMAWFRAYLLSVPKAPERSQIEKELTALEVANEAKIRKILKQVTDLAQTLPEQGEGYANPRAAAMDTVFSAYASSGMIEEAVGLLKLLPAGTWHNENYARQNYATTLVYEGDYQAAEKLIPALTPSSQFSVYGTLIGQYPYSLKDVSQALRYANQITDSSQDYSLVTFIESLGREGHVKEALPLLEKFKAQNMKIDASVKLAKAAAEKGDTDAAKKVLNTAIPLYEEYSKTIQQDAYTLSNYIELTKNLCAALVSVGDTAKARALADALDLSKLDVSADWARKSAVEMYIDIGDLPKAESIASTMYSDNSAISYAKQSLFFAYAEKGDIAKASYFITALQENGFDPYLFPRAYAKLAWIQLKAGDRAGFDSTVSRMPVRNSWDKQDPPMNPGRLYVELCALAYADADMDHFKEFYSKLGENFFKAEVKSIVSYRLKDKGKIDEAQEALLGDESLWEEDHLYLVFDANGYHLVEAQLEKNNKAGAAAFLDKLLALALKFNRFDQLEKIMEFYEKAGQPKKAAELRPKVADFKRTQTAKSFESDAELMDPDGYFKKIQSEKPEEIPSKMSAFAAKLASGLRKIERMKTIK